MKIELDVQAKFARCLAVLYLDSSELGRPLILSSDGGRPPGAKTRHTFDMNATMYREAGARRCAQERPRSVLERGLIQLLVPSSKNWASL